MTQEVACIATRVSGIPELLKHDINGLLVNPEDPQSLARSICELGRDPERRKRLGRRGREDVQQKFYLQDNIPTLVRRFG
jgi:glycosyltransferase involved in cell wall biosynthesis